MKEITKKLRRDCVKHFLPFAEQLEKEGVPRYEIMVQFDRFVDSKIKAYYRTLREPTQLKIHLPLNYDSKAETVFYNMLDKSKIPFDFQYQVGPYRIDFLIAGYLAFEVDGPSHFNADQMKKDKKRDKYLEKMGYTIFRVPLWLIAMDPKAVIEEIKSEVNKFMPLKK